MMKTKIKEQLLIEIEKTRIEITEFSNGKKIDDRRLKEISFISGFEETALDDLLSKLDSNTDLDHMIDVYKLNAITIIEFLILNKNLKFNYGENISNNKPRFEQQIEERKRIFDIGQKYSSEQEYKKLPKRDLVLIYTFREYLSRHEFCDNDSIKGLLLSLGYLKLPKEPKEWKELNTIRISNTVNAMEEVQKKYTDRYDLTDKERDQYSIDFDDALKKANLYKPKKL